MYFFLILSCETCGKNFSATGGLRQHFLTKASCRMNASEGAYSMKKHQQVEILEVDPDQLDQNQVITVTLMII